MHFNQQIMCEFMTIPTTNAIKNRKIGTNNQIQRLTKVYEFHLLQ